MHLHIVLIIALGLSSYDACAQPAAVKPPTVTGKQASISVLFSPADRPTEALIKLIDGTKKSIIAAVYMLTDKKIADALIKARTERNVSVRLALDNISAGRFGKADYLADHGIVIHMYQPAAIRPWFTPILHHKFAVFDDATLWTGSFNWTVSANLSNDENVIITTDPEVCRKYKAYFEQLITGKCQPYRLAKRSPTRSLEKPFIIRVLEDLLRIKRPKRHSVFSPVEAPHAQARHQFPADA